jgi:glycosyltransferase involved in cell wall biosynthesis
VFPPILDILEYCERQGFDEIILGTPGPMGWAGLAIAKLLGIPAIAIHQLDLEAAAEDLGFEAPLSRLAASAQKRWLRSADAILVGDSQAKSELEAEGIPGRRIHALPPVVDRTRYRPDAGNPRHWRSFGLGSGTRVLYSGGLGPESHVEDFLAAFCRLVADGEEAQLVVLGDGPERGELSHRWTHPRILFAGAIDDIEISRVLAGADLLVSLGRADAFGLGTLEAAACGVPSLVTQGTPIARFVIEKEIGIATGPTQEEIESDLRFLLVNAPRRVALGSRAALVAQDFVPWRSILDILFEAGATSPATRVPVQKEAPTATRYGAKSAAAKSASVG